MKLAVLAGAFLSIMTELLGAFQLLNPTAVALTWLAFAICFVRRFPSRPKAVAASDWLLIAPVLLLVTLLGWLAVITPPNTYDAMAYHLPRVVYWAQQHSVASFPTPYLNQLQFPPFAEYLSLHLWLLTGGDHLANLPQWYGYAGSILAASALAADLGASSRAQIITAILVATTPNAILQATGAKNDCVLSFWLLCVILFSRRALEFKQPPWIAACAVALALLTKGTAYLFVLPILLAIVLPRIRQSAALIAASLLLTVLLNGPFYLRNFELSGNPLGFDSAHGDGRYRVRNDRFGWDVTVSNAIRGLSAHLAFRDPATNQLVYESVLATHRFLGIDPADPATTWPDSTFAPPANSNHEASSPNRWQLLLLALALPFALWNRPTRWLTLGWLAAWLLFFSLLRWQPYMARLHLPLFLAGAAIFGLLLDQLRPRFLSIAIALLLLLNARPFVLNNWLRPLSGSESILGRSRAQNYFRDIAPITDYATAAEAVDLIAQSDCRRVGVDSNRMELEYPFLALLLERDPRFVFQHLDVRNASVRYKRPNEPLPCTILCLHCAAESPTLRVRYPHFRPPLSIGKHLIFLPPVLP